MPVYDAIVLGAGGIGSAVLDALARRGARAIAIDRFAPPHDRGSSHGATRIIRLAYFEHPDYVPLLRRAYALWRELQADAGRTLYEETGLLQVGPPDGEIIRGVLDSARRHQLPLELLTSDETSARWPGFRVPDEMAAVYESQAGLLHVEACVRAHLDRAIAAGAELATNRAATAFSADSSGVRVDTDGGTYRAAKLIVAAGPWAGELIAGLGVPLEVRRKSLFWYAPDEPNYSAAFYAKASNSRSPTCPCFLFDLPEGTFYGFPQIDARGVKAAEHSGGRPVADPLAVDRALDETERRRVESFLAAHLPGVGRRMTDHAVCMYTMSPDAHFIVGPHPRLPNVFLAAGLSGHGYKFACVLGEALADLALEGKTSLPIEFLSPDRFGFASNAGRESP